MYPNKLYHFVKNILFHSKSFDKTRLILRQNAQQQTFAMYLLNNRNGFLLDDSSGQYFQLMSHHISFYEYCDDDVPHLSQYHYTAIFENISDKKKHQLHVYLNDYDQVTTAPVFSVQGDNEQYLPQEKSEIFSGILYNFAINYCAIFMLSVRQEFNAHVAKLEQEYQQLEQSMVELSNDLIANRDQYLIQLQQCKQCLTQLTIYVEDEYYYHVARLFERYVVPSTMTEVSPHSVIDSKNSGEVAEITNENQDTTKTVSVIKPMEDVKEDYLRITKSIRALPVEFFEESIKIITSLKDIAKHDDATLSSENVNQIRLCYLASIKPLLSNAEKYFKSPVQTSDINKIKLLYNDKLNVMTQLYELGQDLTFTTENKILAYSESNICHFEKMLKKIREIGKYLLMSVLLLKEDVLLEVLKDAEIAKLLVSLIGKMPLPENMIKMALIKGNDILLNFLLDNSRFAINTYLINQDNTPVLFCFYHHNEKLSLVKCLSVLIKNGATLMVNAADGLPVAYHILDTVDHPLTNALVENSGRTLRNAKFYKVLINQLKQFIKNKELEQNPLDENKKIKLLQFIDRCQQDIEFVSNNQLLPKRFITQKHLSSMAKISSQLNISTHIRVMLKEDPEIKAIFKRVTELTKEYLSNAPAEQKKQAFQQGSKELVKNIDEIVEETDYKDFNECKSNILKHYNDEIKRLQLYIELNEVKSVILSVNISLKNRKKAKQREIAILKELKEPDRDMQANEQVGGTTIFYRNRKKLAKCDEEMSQVMKDFKQTEDLLEQSDMPDQNKTDLQSANRLNWASRLSEIMDKKMQLMGCPPVKNDKLLPPSSTRKP